MGSSDMMFRCRCCQKKMATLDNWSKHALGKKHKHQLELKAMIYRECTLCNVVFAGRKHMVDHVAGKKHQDRSGENGKDPIGDYLDREEEEEERKRCFRKLVKKTRKRAFDDLDYDSYDDSFYG